MDTIDAAFARYSRTGEPEDLARVFDGAAPRLAVLAGHLVPGDRHAVEDLVQTTFLEAIRSAERFTPGRPVMPWLTTILSRRAGNLRRTRSRRRDVAIGEGADAMHDPGRGPIQALEDQEVAEHTAEGLAQLQSPYREVMVLRLVHGLTPAEIARALGRPLGTVHAQLHRGVNRLRGLLPKGIASGLVAALSSSGDAHAMAQIEQNVLREAVQASAAASMAAGATGIGAAALVAGVGKALLVIGGTATLLLGSVAFLHPKDPLITPAPPTEGSVRIVAAETVARTQTVTMTGRLVDPRGSALSGATLLLQTLGADGVVHRSEARSNSEGLFTLEIDPRQLERVTLEMHAHAHVHRRAEWNGELRPGQLVDCGVITLPPAVHTRFRALQADGSPLPTRTLRVGPSKPRRATRFRILGTLQLETDADGFTPYVDLPAGDFRVGAPGYDDEGRVTLAPGGVVTHDLRFGGN